jgi:hypothetical protein
MSSWLLCQHVRGSIKRKLPAFAVNCKGYFYARMSLFLERYCASNRTKRAEYRSQRGGTHPRHSARSSTVEDNPEYSTPPRTRVRIEKIAVTRLAGDTAERKFSRRRRFGGEKKCAQRS